MPAEAATHYDDRLATVLRVRADRPALARIQYRQLLDLLGTSPVDMLGVQSDAAYTRLAELAQPIPAHERAAMLADPGLRLRSPRLVAALAGDEPQVAVAAVRQARLGEEQWLDLIPALPVAARGIVRHRRDLGARVETLLDRLGIVDRGLPPSDASALLQPAAANDGIGAIVRRIEAYRRARAAAPVPANANDAPRLPLGEEPILQAPARAASFDFATNSAGRVTWADPGVAPMVIGSAPFQQAETALRRRQPLRAVTLTLAGAPAIAGDWQADAAPLFDPLSGSFTGYAGRMRRPAAAAAPSAPGPSAAMREADRIRQLLHELRTPVGAIQGFAEVIQQQLFGPSPHEYRALAASIAGDAARVLAAFEELERFAKLECSALAVEAGESDLAAVVVETVARLAPFTAKRNSGFDAKARDGDFTVPLAPIEAERLIWRLLATLAGTSTPGETLELRLKPKDGGVAMTVELPALLTARDTKALFGAAAGAVPQTIASGMFGVGFALRLARSEARAAGGSLERASNLLQLWLPGLTGAGADHTPRSTSAG